MKVRHTASYGLEPVVFKAVASSLLSYSLVTKKLDKERIDLATSRSKSSTNTATPTTLSLKERELVGESLKTVHFGNQNVKQLCSK